MERMTTKDDNGSNNGHGNNSRYCALTREERREAIAIFVNPRDICFKTACCSNLHRCWNDFPEPVAGRWFASEATLRAAMKPGISLFVVRITEGGIRVTSESTSSAELLTS
jgi:hypothetical protein